MRLRMKSKKIIQDSLAVIKLKGSVIVLFTFENVKE
jgi:hypothetical protein